MRYRVLVSHIVYPTDAGVIARLLAGEQVPHDERGEIKRHVAGDVVDDLPACSVPGLLERGEIEPVDAIDEATWRDLGRPDDADHTEGEQ
jgi:hypothetical protein